MKNWIVAPLVGGLIIFIWQFLSWGLINLHEPAQQYTPKQEAIMNFLNSQQLPEGGYLMPTLPKTATNDEWSELMKNSEGKPWMSVQYHAAQKNNMGMNIFRSLVTDFLTVLLLCWILLRTKTLTFRTIFLSSLFTGFIVFLNAPYTGFIWYESFDIWAHFLDAVVSWGLCGLWLAWWLRKANRSVIHARERVNTLVTES